MASAAHRAIALRLAFNLRHAIRLAIWANGIALGRDVHPRASHRGRRLCYALDAIWAGHRDLALVAREVIAQLQWSARGAIHQARAGIPRPVEHGGTLLREGLLIEVQAILLPALGSSPD